MSNYVTKRIDTGDLVMCKDDGKAYLVVWNDGQLVYLLGIRADKSVYPATLRLGDVKYVGIHVPLWDDIPKSMFIYMDYEHWNEKGEDFSAYLRSLRG